MGGFEFTVVQRNLKEEHERPWTYVCERQRKATKVGSTASVRNSVLIISHVTFRDCRDHLSVAVCITYIVEMAQNVGNVSTKVSKD